MYTWVCACFPCMLVFAVNARHAPVPFETNSHTALVTYYLARLCSWWTPETYLSQSLLHLDYSCMWPHPYFLHGFWRSKLRSLSLHSGHFPQPNSFCFFIMKCKSRWFGNHFTTERAMLWRWRHLFIWGSLVLSVLSSVFSHCSFPPPLCFL